MRTIALLFRALCPPFLSRGDSSVPLLIPAALATFVALSPEASGPPPPGRPTNPRHNLDHRHRCRRRWHAAPTMARRSRPSFNSFPSGLAPLGRHPLQSRRPTARCRFRRLHQARIKSAFKCRQADTSIHANGPR